MKPTSFIALSILLVTGGCPYGPGSQPPSPDDCSSPSALDGIDAIELGALENGAFVPWRDNEIVELTWGGQGGVMIGVVVSLRGSSLPVCMEHTMELTDRNGDRMAITDYPVRTYPVPDGTRATQTIWLILQGLYPDQGDQLELTLQIGGREVRRSLLVEASRPVSMEVVGGSRLSAGSEHTLEIFFDRFMEASVEVTVESSDPAVVRPVSPTLQVSLWDVSQPVTTELEAVAPGGPVTISVTANSQTITTEVTVQ